MDTDQIDKFEIEEIQAIFGIKIYYEIFVYFIQNTHLNFFYYNDCTPFQSFSIYQNFYKILLLNINFINDYRNFIEKFCSIKEQLKLESSVLNFVDEFLNIESSKIFNQILSSICNYEDYNKNFKSDCYELIYRIFFLKKNYKIYIKYDPETNGFCENKDFINFVIWLTNALNKATLAISKVYSHYKNINSHFKDSIKSNIEIYDYLFNISFYNNFKEYINFCLDAKDKILLNIKENIYYKNNYENIKKEVETLSNSMLNLFIKFSLKNTQRYIDLTKENIREKEIKEIIFRIINDIKINVIALKNNYYLDYKEMHLKSIGYKGILFCLKYKIDGLQTSLTFKNIDNNFNKDFLLEELLKIQEEFKYVLNFLENILNNKINK